MLQIFSKKFCCASQIVGVKGAIDLRCRHTGRLVAEPRRPPAKHPNQRLSDAAQSLFRSRSRLERDGSDRHDGRPTESAGRCSGRSKSTKGPVLHLVLSFDERDDTSRDAMEGAADAMLAKLGADPAKMRGKSKPKQRQFADEHQAIFYAQSDTRNTHLHVMVNTVHPEHGTRLPTSNNYNKLQAWALEHTKEMGTEANYPRREENAEARKRGDYVKETNRSTTRNMWELDKAVRDGVMD